jgi:hypothetical protein
MKALWNPPEQNSLAFILAVLWRALALLLVFMVLYYQVQPLERDWTLYNRVYPGRLRFAYNEPGAMYYAANETRLKRLVADHVFAQPKRADEYRVVVLGSSETWGLLNRPQDPMAVQLGALGLTAPDGRKLSSYNLGYVWPDAFKELLVLRAALSNEKRRPDLVILAWNPYAFDPPVAIHWLANANPEETTRLVKQYQLGNYMDEVEARLTGEPDFWRRGFLGQRTDLANALVNQVYGFAWTLNGVDQFIPPELPHNTQRLPDIAWSNHRPKHLDAVLQEAARYNVPVLMVSVPINFGAPAYNQWLRSEAQRLAVPLLDCSDLLPYQEFTNTKLHITAAGHKAFAQQVGGLIKQFWANSVPENKLLLCPSGIK